MDVNRQSTEDFQGNETALYDIIMVDICHSFVKAHRMYNIKVNTDVNYGLCVIMMYPCRFIEC